MQFVNKVELLGVVGKVNRQHVPAENGEMKEVIRFSVVTEASSKDEEGQAVIDVTWFNCCAWGAPGAFDHAQKGMVARVHGRLRRVKYINIAGVEHEMYEVLCSEVTFSESNGMVQPMEG